MNNIISIIKRLSPNKYIAKTDKTELEKFCDELDEIKYEKLIEGIKEVIKAKKYTKKLKELLDDLIKDLQEEGITQEKVNNLIEEAIEEIKAIRADFWANVRVTGTANEFNQELEKAGRVADFIELAELMCTDALERNESCGGHFREEYQTEEGEAQRDDNNYCHAAVWNLSADGTRHELTKEPLTFEEVHLVQRSYK